MSYVDSGPCENEIINYTCENENYFIIFSDLLYLYWSIYTCVKIINSWFFFIEYCLYDQNKYEIYYTYIYPYLYFIFGILIINFFYEYLF
jgi:hypothetical protein